MRPLYWELALTIVVGAGAGLFGGQAVIAGMAPPAVGAPSYPIDDEAAPTADAAPAEDPVDDRRIAAACPGCSEFDLGYRFAAARGLRSTADCMDYSWSYQRGCLAYLREG